MSQVQFNDLRGLKKREFSVIDFGATGDGTTDDTAAIQAAITAASVADGRVWIPRGVYKVTSTITIASKHISIEGAGPNSTQISIPATFTLGGLGVFVFTSTYPNLPEMSKTQYAVKNLKIRFAQPDEAATTNFVHYPYALYFDAVGAIEIDSVTIECAWEAVNLTNSSGGQINHLWYSAFSTGLNVDATANNLAVNDLKAWIFGTTDNQNAAMAKASAYKAIQLGQADGFSMTNSLVYNGSFEKNKGAAGTAVGTFFVSNTVFDQFRGFIANTGWHFFDNCWFINFDGTATGVASGVAFTLTGGQTYISNSLMISQKAAFPYALVSYDEAALNGANLLKISSSVLIHANATEDFPFIRFTGANSATNHLVLADNIIRRSSPDLGGGNYGQPMVYIANGTTTSNAVTFTGNRVVAMTAGSSPLLTIVDDSAHHVDLGGALASGWTYSFPALQSLGQYTVRRACSSYTVTYADDAFIAADTEVSVTLGVLPARSKVTGVNIKHSVIFSDGAGAMTEVSVSVGDGTDHTAYSAATNIGEATAVADTAFLDTAQFKSTTTVAGNLVARFTATGRNFGDGAATYLVSGSVTITVDMVTLP